MFKKFAQTTAAMTIALGFGIASMSQPADARGGRTAAIVGLGALGVLGLAAAANAGNRTYYNDRCYRVGGGCYWREGSCVINRYGDEVCRKGYKVCEPRRTVCD